MSLGLLVQMAYSRSNKSGLREQNVKVAYPKDKLEFKFFLSPDTL